MTAIQNARTALRPLVPPLLADAWSRTRHPEAWRVRGELHRLHDVARFRPGTTPLLGRELAFVDAASAASAYEAIFVQEVYRFRPKRPRPVILDCGANIGLSTIYFHRLCPDAQIVAFEPDEAAFDALRRNCATIGIHEVRLASDAVWRESGRLPFSSNGADGGHLDHGTDGERSPTSVSCVRLLDLLDRPVDMLKMDIEGAEVEVLLDCAPRLTSVDHLFVEYHSFVDQPQRLAELLSVLQQSGFRVHVHSELASPQPFMSRSVCNGKDSRLNIFAFRT